MADRTSASRFPARACSSGENLTPDKETGLGDWTSEQIIAAIRTGKTPEGRDLSPVMPYAAFSHLTDADAEAIAAFLKSLPPVSNKVKNFGPKEPVTVSVSAVLPPAVYNALPGVAEIAAERPRDHFGRKSRPTPLLTN